MDYERKCNPDERYTIQMRKTALLAFAVSFAAQLTAAENWNSKSAAAYLDGRSEWWETWSKSARDHGTFCVSCHTAVPYGISRLTLRSALGEKGPSAPEQKLLANVTKRVRIWGEAEPFYKDNPGGPTKSSESRGTESVLNALILSAYDAPTGKLTDDTRTAFNNMWALQITSGEKRGAWIWLDFHNRPWEADDSQFYGAALAAVAVGATPAEYRANPDVKEKLELLKTYLKTNYDGQSPVNRLAVLWASSRITGILTEPQKKSLIEELASKQQPDGGWSLSALAGIWKRRDKTELETKSDGYATGQIAYILQQAGVSRDQKPVKQGLAWLAANQSKTDGLWEAYSLNKERDLSSDIGLFMSDAATAYAVMALTAGN
jgi:squalene-hopene/tetraprenyl-beta-curcumene cyclase